MTRRPALLLALSTRLRSAAYLRKWVPLAALIGVVSGLAATLFFWALEAATALFLGVGAGYVPASPMGEGGAPIVSPDRPWLIPVIVALGGLVSGVVVYRLAPEAEGHGTDAAIAAFHHHARTIRARIPVIKMLASAITIGSGGSGGREGPTAQIGAGFGSFLARALDLDARDARIAVACGMGAGIGAIFRAPLGGAILAAEIPYAEDVESDALVPSFVASIVAFAVFGALVGFDPIFGEQAQATFSEPVHLLSYAFLGLVAGVVGRLYVGVFVGSIARFERLRLPRELKPALGGFLVGLLALAVPGALGTGYGWVQETMTRDALLALPLWMVLVLPFAKILATSLSIGSGGSGGVFGPGMVIGGLLGAGLWRLLEPLGTIIPSEPAGFVIVAMMALFGSIAHAPIAVMLMVAEMTGNLAMLAPGMVAIGVAVLVVGDVSIYRSQLPNRMESPAHRFRVAMPLLAAIGVGDAARQPRAVARIDEPIRAVTARVLKAQVPGVPVVDAHGALVGVVELTDLEQGVADAEVRTVRRAPDPVLAPDDRLDDALAALVERHRSWAPVVTAGRVVGVLSVRDAMRAYRGSLDRNVRRVRALRAGGVVIEGRLAPESPLVGRTVAEIPWPRDAILVAVERGHDLLVPRGSLRLGPGDHLSVFADASAEPELRRMLTPGSAPDAQPGTPEVDELLAAEASGMQEPVRVTGSSATAEEPGEGEERGTAEQSGGGAG